MRQRFTMAVTIEIDYPEPVSRTEAIDYVRAAVASWGGQFRPPGAYAEDDPGDPFFTIRKTTVRGLPFAP